MVRSAPRVLPTSSISATSHKRYLSDDSSHETKRGKRARLQNTYSEITTNDNGRAHLGDNYQHIEYHGTINQYSNSIESQSQNLSKCPDVLESLKYVEIHDRYSEIELPYVKTCQWLFDREEYKAWLKPLKQSKHNGVLWIKGKPGTGKSILTKCAIDHAQVSLKDSNSIVIFFFFHARGEDIEKCAEGAYRSLLVQLLEKIPRLQGLLGKQRSRNRWPVKVLSNIFHQAVMALGENSLTCFIDGLDECSEAEARYMIRDFGELTQSATAKNVDLRIYLSSRHYPHINLKTYQELILEQQGGHENDIAAYIKKTLTITGRLKPYITKQIQCRASGIFLWVFLVISILNEASDHGHAHAIKARLEEIPDDLDELFQDMIRRGTQTNIYLVPMLQWIMFAKRPLSCEELHCVVVYTSAGTTEAIEAKDSFDPSDIRKFLIDSSKGLAEMTRGNRPRVQFIHESVRDYLRDTGFSALTPELSNNVSGLTHDFLKQCCWRFISESVCEQLSLPNPLPTAKSKEMRKIRAQAAKKLPFLQYAVSNIFYHAEGACETGVVQDEFVQTFPISVWATFSNMFEKHQIRRYTAILTKTYIFAEKGALRLLDAELQRQQSHLTRTQERHRTALCAAVYNEHAEVVAMILKHGAMAVYSHAEQRRCFRTAVNSQSAEVLRLLKGDVDAADTSKALQAVLYRYSLDGNLEAVKFLLEHGCSVDSRGTEHGSALQAACCGGHPGSYGRDGGFSRSDRGHEKVAQLLLERNAKFNTEGGIHSNALQAACCGRLAKIVEVMVKKGANVNAHGGVYGYALQAACARGSSETVRLLLEYGADVNARGGYYGNALHAACTSIDGSEDVALMLVEHGAEIDAEGGACGNVLQAACYQGYKKVVKIMLDMGARVDVQGSKGGYALEAVCSGYLGDDRDGIVELLLEHGADVDARGGEYYTALQAACHFQGETIVQMLLEKGADVNAQGGDCHNALMAVCSRGNFEFYPGSREKIVKMLLEHGADVDARGGEYYTALQAACHFQGETIVQMLLEKGADVNAQGGDCHNALMAVCSRGNFEFYPGSREKIVKMLIEHGVDVNARGGWHRTALQVACYHHREKVVQMLLDNGADVNAKGPYGDAIQAVNAKPAGLHFSISARREEKRIRECIIRMLRSHG